MRSDLRLLRACLTAGLALLVGAPAATAVPIVQGHRGGSVLDGVPSFPEDTMPAFEHAAAEQLVIEIDVKLTEDGVPVVIHDDTPDRTTTCDEGRRIADYDLAELRGCKADVLGSPGSGLATAPVAEPSVAPPTMAEVLDLARRTGARVNLEIKNLPTDNDYDPTPAYATRIVDGIAASGLPLSQLIVQSFDPANLDVAEQRLLGVETSLLTLAPTNDGGPSVAKSKGYEWISPGWPVSQSYVSQAHQLGLRVVPYTLNTPQEVKAAAAIGVDELITDDPAMARAALAQVEPPAPAIPPPPSAADCKRVRAARTAPTIETLRPRPGAPRVFAMQFMQELRHVVTYEDFRTKIECSVRDVVVPQLAKGRPNVVAFNEDIGLMTIATGSRGAAARDAFGEPGAPGCESQGAPCSTIVALGLITAAYGPQVAAYRTRFGPETPVSDAFVAATDTFARGWMQVFSDIAKRYGVYILGSNNQPLFRESTDPLEIDLFRDPDLPRPQSVFVATADEVFNEVFMWGPEDVRPDGPRVLRNVVARNKKVPVTPIEEQIQIAPGPATGPDGVQNVAPYALPGTAARIGFATSLPAFVYGEPPAGVDPCSDTSKYYMRCMDRLGVNLVMQDEANPGRWAGDGGGGYWQPLEWMRSTWRAASDPSVDFDYNVTPHMVGNLADLAFDGQTAITQRGLGAGASARASEARRGLGAGASARASGARRGPRAVAAAGERCTYVGNTRFVEGVDPEQARDDAGPKREFLAISPWAAPDGPRSELRAVSAKLAPGSGDAIENQYVETAIVADLPYPPDPARPACATAAVEGGGDPGGSGGGGGGATAGGDPGSTRRAAATNPGGGSAGTGASGDGSLPFTGLLVAALAAAAMALLAGGLALRKLAASR